MTYRSQTQRLARLVQCSETCIAFALNVDRDEIDLVDIAAGERCEQQIPQLVDRIHIRRLGWIRTQSRDGPGHVVQLVASPARILCLELAPLTHVLRSVLRTSAITTE
jgi:hypothetical protein